MVLARIAMVLPMLQHRFVASHCAIFELVTCEFVVKGPSDKSDPYYDRGNHMIPFGAVDQGVTIIIKGFSVLKYVTRLGKTLCMGSVCDSRNE